VQHIPYRTIFVFYFVHFRANSNPPQKLISAVRI